MPIRRDPMLFYRFYSRMLARSGPQSMESSVLSIWLVTNEARIVAMHLPAQTDANGGCGDQQEFIGIKGVHSCTRFG